MYFFENRCFLLSRDTLSTSAWTSCFCRSHRPIPSFVFQKRRFRRFNKAIFPAAAVGMPQMMMTMTMTMMMMMIIIIIIVVTLHMNIMKANTVFQHDSTCMCLFVMFLFIIHGFIHYFDDTIYLQSV